MRRRGRARARAIRRARQEHPPHESSQSSPASRRCPLVTALWERAVTRAAGARACPRPAALSCDPRSPASAASRFPQASEPTHRPVNDDIIRVHPDPCLLAGPASRRFRRTSGLRRGCCQPQGHSPGSPVTSRPTPEAVRVCPDRRVCCRAAGSAGLVTVRSVSRPVPRNWYPARVRLLHQRRPGPRPSQGSPYVASGSGRF